ncbi:hypothetical protein [Thauera linaloolentis]|uniref:Uncharacterized protein n=1 Tax=Thauera linaloolentis (strain DSM 12138 / JCM 21573 / CCUG 41526 / CIP 105981 / IAM 15112 / NBRC 102519 / 47Lol) TaxID=1123367 RepID=N6YND2_THAL4|nr:hypothetical protein [Thauera linaloolentis]ENO83842.1 hypothetical protein C666_18380 [Thauera linaloolentis 47Lol = DSM 12138]MCM8567355.1 hypothetical protein [Thauera linaloolentis]
MPKRPPPRPIAALTACAMLLCAGHATAAQTLIICTDLDDAERTRAVLSVEEGAAESGGGPRVSSLEIVTPEFLWSAPGQPETARFPAGRSDVSPDLAGLDTVAIRSATDADGVLRIVDFGVLRPGALELEGLRGSLVLHETWQNAHATGSLYYTSAASRPTVAALACQRFDED